MFLFYDVETSGLDRSSDIYEFGFVRTDERLNVISSGTLYFYQKEWDIQATQIHKLTRQYLEAYEKDFSKNLATLYALCHNAIWIGKNNIGYDNMVLTNFLGRYQPKDIAGIWTGGTADIQSMCGRRWREWRRKEFGEDMGRKSGNLQDYMLMASFTKDVLEWYMKENNIVVPKGRDELHSALYDAVMTLCAAKYCIVKFGDSLI